MLQAIKDYFIRREIHKRLPALKETLMLSGYKTYLVAAALVLFGVTGYLTGNLEANEATQQVLAGLGFAGLRAGISKGGAR